MSETSLILDSARAEFGARADWQVSMTHTFLLDHGISCTVFPVIAIFAMTTMTRSFTTHLISSAVQQTRFRPDSRESDSNPGLGLT